MFISISKLEELLDEIEKLEKVREWYADKVEECYEAGNVTEDRLRMVKRMRTGAGVFIPSELCEIIASTAEILKLKEDIEWIAQSINCCEEFLDFLDGKNGYWVECFGIELFNSELNDKLMSFKHDLERSYYQFNDLLDYFNNKAKVK